MSYLYGWKDGLAAALRILGKECELKIYTQGSVKVETVVHHEYFDIFVYPDWQSMAAQVEADKPDACLFWADMTRPAIDRLATQFPSAICFAGGDPIMNATRLFKKIFVESNEYLERLQVAGFPVELAFGCNTALFKPQKQPKTFDAFFPATYADWKRHALFAGAVEGLPAMACGNYQAHEPWCYDVCVEKGVFTTKHIFPDQLVDFYNASRTVVITSANNGGSQRSVLEALACNIPCIVMVDSQKCSQYIYEAGCGAMVVEPNKQDIRAAIERWKDRPMETRGFVLANYSEEMYAAKLLAGLKEICGQN